MTLFIRRLLEEVYQHLRKKGLVPEKERVCDNTKTVLADFDAQRYQINSISSSTLWKVCTSRKSQNSVVHAYMHVSHAITSSRMRFCTMKNQDIAAV
jgi:hypothetical protein